MYDSVCVCETYYILIWILVLILMIWYLFNHILGTTQKLAKPEKYRQKPPFGDIPVCKTLKSPEIHCHLTLHGIVGLILIDFELDFQTIV